MRYQIRNISIPLQEITEGNERSLLAQRARKLLNVPLSDIGNVEIVRESIDSRHKRSISCVYTILASVDGKIRETGDISAFQSEEPEPVFTGTPTTDPVIAGAGPSGLFCAWELADKGFSPIVVERGETVDQRSLSVERFWREGILNPESNVQFGEGGAGTFSDGKLTTRIHDPRCGSVLKILKECGAPDDIVYKAKAHIGTDVLRGVITNMRERLTARGVRFRFSTRVDSIITDGSSVTGVRLSDSSVIDTRAVVLAIGHSARDTLKNLFEQGVDMVPKAFSVGARIEHLQETINRAQYGDTKHFKLTAADYQLYEHMGERTAYTFCMCPGGIVVAAASEPETTVTNGMSYRNRDGRNANAAWVVSVDPRDFGSGHPLAGFEFQKELEGRCYRHCGRYAAPVQRLADFMDHRASIRTGKIKPTYTGETILSDLHVILPGFVTEAMERSVAAFDRKLKGFFDPDAILTAVETRTSSPVRISRNEHLQSPSYRGLFPAGEGAGYAGGIISAAVDGMRVAGSIASDFSR